MQFIYCSDDVLLTMPQIRQTKSFACPLIDGSHEQTQIVSGNLSLVALKQWLHEEFKLGIGQGIHISAFLLIIQTIFLLRFILNQWLKKNKRKGGGGGGGGVEGVGKKVKKERKTKLACYLCLMPSQLDPYFKVKKKKDSSQF